MLRVAQVAERLGLSETVVYQLIATREIAHFRIGTGRGTIRVRQEDVEEYLTARRVERGRARRPPKRTSSFVHLDPKKLAAAWEGQD